LGDVFVLEFVRNARQ